MDMPAHLMPDPEADARRAAVEDILFGPVESDAGSETPLALYGLIDASRRSDISMTLDAYADPARCLFDGETGEQLAQVAPWLVQFTRHGSAWDWFYEEGFGNDWGILIQSRLALPNLKARLKGPLSVTDEDGKEYYFKFYRPRHLNDYLPVMEPDQLAQMMRGVETYYAEDVAMPGGLWQHRMGADGALESHRIPLDTGAASSRTTAS